VRLKRVKIFGFKTFADKTEFDLDGDLVAVVGPNGCGKSNIVDAILWGLGEPNARQLRAANSQEIIFNGSANRKALGFAEVSLLFDNEDGSLPIDAPEVTITRRVHRNGDSEYEINRQRCRLKDIFDILADSGLGRSGYAIVGQKEIDAALAASAVDRRAWIDEAAGVQRYRAKRVESLRRLDHTRQHLVQVNQILAEIDAQRGPLEKEAEVAVQYRAATALLRSIETVLLSHELVESIQKIEAADEKIQSFKTRVEQESERAEELNALSLKLGEEISEIERRLDATRELKQSTISAMERAESNARLAEQRLQSLVELESNITEDKGANSERIAQYQEQLQTLTKEEKEATETLERLRAENESSTGVIAELHEKLAKANADLETARKLHHDLVRWTTEQKMRKTQLAELTREKKGIEQGLPELRQSVADAQKAFDEAKALLDGLKAEKAGLQQAGHELADREKNRASRTRVLAEQIAALSGKKRGIEATLDAHEGFAQGTRAVLAAVEQGVLHHDFVPVATAIDVPPDLATAIEIALGASGNDLICDHESHAKAAIQWLKEHRLGRTTFQPIPMMRPYVQRQEMHILKRERGVVGIASELVQCSAKHRPVIDSILGRVLIVETIDDGLRLGKSQGWSRLVTLDGEVIHSSGAVTGGTSSKQGNGILQRKADLDEVIRELEKLTKELDRAQSHIESGESEDLEIRQKLVALDKKLHEVEQESHDAHRWHANLKLELTQTERRLERIEEELVALAQQGEKPEDGHQDIPELEAHRDALLREIAATSSSEGLIAERMTDLMDRIRGTKSQIQSIQDLLLSESTSTEGRSERLSLLAQERQRALDQRAQHLEEAAQAKAHVDRLSVDLDALSAKKQEAIEKNFSATEESRRAMALATSMREQVRETEIDRVRIESRRAVATQKLLEEYGMDELDAKETAEKETIPENGLSEAHRLRREIRAMGEVNLGAIEAFARLNERYGELGLQRDDVQQGMDEIVAGIEELDKLTKDRFRDTFHKVREQFQEMLVKLFQGGEGTLVLTDPENLLESGVDVEVTIPGKKKQRLELLSGGERALAASAFLFSLLRVKPSPLVVLDEVDAPLDGRNVERFVTVMKEFSGQIQFVCITHNPQTIGAAPMWFGVTMQEPGVSTVIPYKTLQPVERERISMKG